MTEKLHPGLGSGALREALGTMKNKYRKAVATRRQRKAETDYYHEVTEPGNRRLNVIMNALLDGKRVSLR